MNASLLMEFEYKIYFFFQGLQRPWLDYFLAWPTKLGETFLGLTTITAIILLIDRKKGLRNVGIAAIAILLADWVSEILKQIINRPRPYVVWENAHVIFYKARSSAFPSGHAMIVFCMAYLLYYFYPQKMRWVWIVAVWLGLTRVYVGVHYFTDVLAGAVLGVLCAAVVCRILPEEKL